MKCIVITQPGPPDVLQVQERDTPVPAEDEILIRVEAAGVNRPDIFQRKGNYPAPPGVVADIPGLEIAGTVEACGDKVTRWKTDDKVCALTGGGGYAEYVTVSQDHCLRIPKGLTAVEAASLPETVFTVWHNVFERGQLSAGEHLLVHGGSSGIGVTAIQLAKAKGAKVSITAGSDEKCHACSRLGADVAINYSTSDFEEIVKSQGGADVILDMIGGDYIPRNLKILKEDGRLVFINAMKGGKFEWNALDIMRRRLTITGSTLRARSSSFKARLTENVEKHVWPLIDDAVFKPVVYKTLSIADAAAAHQLMENGGHIGKIILINDWPSRQTREMKNFKSSEN